MSFIKRSIALVGTIILTLPNIAFASPTVSVPDFKDKSGNLPWWSDKMSKQFADVLSNELSNAGLSVVERQKLDDVLSEQELADLGIVSKTASNNSTAKRGQMKGAQFIVLGSISAYDENAGKVASSSSGGFMGISESSSTLESTVYIALDLRVVNSTSGEIVAAKTVEGTAKNSIESKSSDADMSGIGNLISSGSDSRGAKLMGGVFGSMKQKSSTVVEQKVPRKKAIRAAMITASDYVSCVLVKRDECLAEFEAQDKRRRSNTLDLLNFD